MLATVGGSDDVDYSLRVSLSVRRVLLVDSVSRCGGVRTEEGGPMNNLQLFRMYQRFKQRQTIANYNYSVCEDDLALADWEKWYDLSGSACEELEKRLTPPAGGSSQHFNDAVAYWAQPTLYVVPKKERAQ